MIGSVAIAAFVAEAAYVVLMVWGWACGELGPTALTLFALVGVLAVLGLPRIPAGANLVTPALAVIDLALVFKVFKGDVRIG